MNCFIFNFAMAPRFRCKFIAPNIIAIEILVRGNSLEVAGTGGGDGGSSSDGGVQGRLPHAGGGAPPPAALAVPRRRPRQPRWPRRPPWQPRPKQTLRRPGYAGPEGGGNPGGCCITMKESSCWCLTLLCYERIELEVEWAAFSRASRVQPGANLKQVHVSC